MSSERDLDGTAARSRTQGPTVLVIDDDDVGRALLCEALGTSCKRIIQLSSPIGATRQAMQEQVDVVVLDVEMPNLRGDMLAKLFRSNARIAHVGVILVSGCDSDELERLGTACGADEVVSKRHVRSSLPNAVQKSWIHSRRRAAASADGKRSAPNPEPEAPLRGKRHGSGT
jgi:PleD family two-component response regulator